MSQSLNPSIDFKHVLSELSVNRTDPCEVIRELISNSYDANAKYIRYSPIIEQDGFIFYDNGIGLDLEKSEKGISSYEAFFSIGRSTKTKGTSIGYKCQGSKLCFAASRFLVITKTKKSNWIYKIIENPRENLTPSFNIYPSTTTKPSEILYSFINNNGINTLEILKKYDFDFFEKNNVSGTLIVLLKFDTENFSKHFYVNGKASESYLYNYIRCNTKHGDVTAITAAQGYKASAIKAVNTKKIAPLFEIITHTDSYETPYGFPYLIKPN
jgi:hypothetical protein